MFNHILTSLATNVRVGHATNSSSTHSIILTHETPSSRLHDDDYFGWQSFVLADKKSKQDYLGSMLAANYNSAFRPREYDAEAMSVMHEHAVKRATALVGEFEYKDIDHQSTWSFPRDAHNDIHVGFVQWLVGVFARDDLVVLGGNDNDDDSTNHGITGYADPVPLFTDEFASPPYCIDQGTYWCIWYRKSGLKLRINKDVTDKRTLKGLTPELVDIKVTDYCDAGCAYCYQGSTTKGKHAKARVYEVTRALHELGVLEVAIGGGEPLLWPDIESFVYNLSSAGINANVTTRRPDLITESIYRYLSGIGLSADSASALKKMVDVVKKKFPTCGNYLDQHSIVAHVVVGTMTAGEFRKILTYCRDKFIPVLLLGYKTDGRGSNVDPKNVDWIQIVKDMPARDRPRIGVDTKIVADCGPSIVSELGVDARLMTNAEGVHSMYIDLVANEFAKASYGDVERRPLNWAVIPETFQTWR